MARLTRRSFLHMSAMGFGSAIISVAGACHKDDGTSRTGDTGSPVVDTDSGTEPTVTPGVAATFLHGVASGDPLADRVVLWTRVTPETDGAVLVRWQVATDEKFAQVLIDDSGVTDATRDYTVKVDAVGLQPGTQYYYRFQVGTATSRTGVTRTLDDGSPSEVSFVVLSCANYPAGYFHVYGEVARLANINAVVHLGDYIYEYARGEYASEDAAALGREVEPAGELFTLADYRARYGQYRTDEDLKAAHAALPFIAVWDDHEVANDAWKGGAENHEKGEGDYVARRDAALQAYAEWMPIRPAVDMDVASLARSFKFGDLVNLLMLDTRIVGRDQQINIGAFFDPNTGAFDAASYAAAVGDPARTLLGADQLAWLQSQLADKSTTWHVLGQQVLMGEMELPVAVLPTNPDDPSTAPLTFDEFGLLVTLATIQGRLGAGDPTVTQAEIDLLAAYGQFLADNSFWLTAGTLPYNLDAWDGYPVERGVILGTAAANGVNLVVLAGDTHNAWASNLEFDGTAAGVEFATASVSSPGLEVYLGLIQAPDPAVAISQTEAAVVAAIPNLAYANLGERGFLTVTFTKGAAVAKWTFVDSVKSKSYAIRADRSTSLAVIAGTNVLSV